MKAGVTMNGDPLWTAYEESILREHYPDYATIQKRLPRRSLGGAQARCRRLGLASKVRPWRAAEIANLRKLYPSASIAAICAAFPERGWQAIRSQAIKHGFRRGPYRYRRSGKAVMDQILTKIEEIGWNLTDLDEESRSGRYFRHHTWRYNSLNFAAVEKAVRTLGGEITVEWDRR